MKKKQDGLPAGRQGFTIVELTIYSAILIIFLYVLTSAFAGVIDVHLSSQATSAVVTDSRYLFARFAYDIGRAEDIVMPPSLGAQTSTLTLTIDGAPVIYAVTDGHLDITDASGTERLNSVDTTISNVSFRRYGNQNGKHSVRIAFTLTSVTERASGSETRSFQTTIGLR